MMVYRIGRMAGEHTIYLPEDMRTTSVPGQIYELQMKTNGVSNPQEALLLLADELAEGFSATMLYFEVDGDVITVQMVGSPFAWGALLLFLPQILVGLGILVTMIAVYLVGSTIPSWVYGVVLVGSLLVALGPKMAGAVTSEELRRNR